MMARKLRGFLLSLTSNMLVSMTTINVTIANAYDVRLCVRVNVVKALQRVCCRIDGLYTSKKMLQSNVFQDIIR